MLSISGHPNPKDIQPGQDLYVISAGMDKDCAINIDRPKGRDDFHIVYMAEGWGLFQVGGRPLRVEAGHCVLYRPFAPQGYAFPCDRPLRRYWIHFRGHRVEQLLRELGFFEDPETPVQAIRNPEGLENCFMQIIRELQIQDRHYDMLCANYLNNLLVLLSRNFDHQSKQSIAKYDLLKKLVFYINDNCAENLPVEAYAKMCYLSKYRFIENFKKFTGYTPIDYRNKLRVEKARQLLAAEDMAVYTVAERLGFHSASYFSTVFKRFTGCSPQVFVKRNRDK